MSEDHTDALLMTGEYIVIVQDPWDAPLARRWDVDVITRRTGYRTGAAWLDASESRRGKPPLSLMIQHAIYYHDRMAPPRKAGRVFVKPDKSDIYGDPP